jgi:hypothetical protein
VSTIASLDDLTAVCGPISDEAKAQTALEEATAILQSLTGQQLVPVDDDRVLLNGDGASVLLLPELPVRAIDAVKVEGVALDPDDYEWATDGRLRLTGVCAVFPDRYQSVDVTYDHGFEPMPDDLRLTAARLACRITKGEGAERAITWENVGAYSVRYATGLTASESAVIARYRVAA